MSDVYYNEAVYKLFEKKETRYLEDHEKRIEEIIEANKAFQNNTSEELREAVDLMASRSGTKEASEPTIGNVAASSFRISANDPEYYDGAGEKIGITLKEFLFVRISDEADIVFGRVMRTDPGSILIVDEVSGETHFLASGSNIVGHYDRFGEEIYRDPLETIDTDKIYTRNGWKKEGENFFVSSNEVSKEDYRTNNGITFCYRGVPPDADKMFGMIQFIGHGALVETVYLQTQEKYDEWIEESQGCPFRAFVNPRYRELLELGTPKQEKQKTERGGNAQEQIREADLRIALKGLGDLLYLQQANGEVIWPVEALHAFNEKELAICKTILFPDTLQPSQNKGGKYR